MSRKAIGNSVWLLILLWMHAPEGGGTAPLPVAQGNLITDEELAARLEVKPSMIARWRRTLRRLRYVEWANHGHKERSYYVRPLNGMALSAKPRQTQGENPKPTAPAAKQSFVN